VVWVGVLLATTAIGKRDYLRIKYRGRFQLDDISTAFALALLIVSAVMYSIAYDPLFTLALVGSGLEYPPPDNFIETSELCGFSSPSPWPFGRAFGLSRPPS
jgi:hypothetical protein